MIPRGAWLHHFGVGTSEAFHPRTSSTRRKLVAPRPVFPEYKRAFGEEVCLCLRAASDDRLIWTSISPTPKLRPAHCDRSNFPNSGQVNLKPLFHSARYEVLSSRFSSAPELRCTFCGEYDFSVLVFMKLLVREDKNLIFSRDRVCVRYASGPFRPSSDTCVPCRRQIRRWGVMKSPSWNFTRPSRAWREYLLHIDRGSVSGV